MNRKMQHQADLFAVLEQAGVTDYRVEQGRKHRKLRFVHDGRERLYVFSTSPSDRRSTVNAVTDLRAILGVRRERRDGSRRRRLTIARAVKAPETITILPDPWEALRDLRDAMEWERAKESYHLAPKGKRTERMAALRAVVAAQLRRNVGVA